MKKNLKVLFIGRKNDKYSKKIFFLLKNSFTNVLFVESSKHHEKIDNFFFKWSGDYILSFRSYIILPESILRKAKIAAINFHPGTPEYRGIGCINYAIYNEKSSYGVTAHLMNKNIDNGKILKISKFNISKIKNLNQILQLTHKRLFEMTISFIELIKKNNLNLKEMIEKNKKIKWAKKIYKKKDMEKLYTVSKNINEKNLAKLLKATVYGKFNPVINLYGRKFVYEKKK